MKCINSILAHKWCSSQTQMLCAAPSQPPDSDRSVFSPLRTGPRKQERERSAGAGRRHAGSFSPDWRGAAPPRAKTEHPQEVGAWGPSNSGLCELRVPLPGTKSSVPGPPYSVSSPQKTTPPPPSNAPLISLNMYPCWTLSKRVTSLCQPLYSTSLGLGLTLIVTLSDGHGHPRGTDT